MASERPLCVSNLKTFSDRGAFTSIDNLYFRFNFLCFISARCCFLWDLFLQQQLLICFMREFLFWRENILQSLRNQMACDNNTMGVEWRRNERN